MGHSTFFPPTYITNGITVSISANDFIVTASAPGTFTSAMINQQIRIGGQGGNTYPTYTIVQILSDTQVLIDTPWIGPTQVAQPFQVFVCYFQVPSDFQYFVSMINTTSNYRLWTNLTQAEIDLADPQRIQQGISFATAFYDFTPNYAGTVGSAVQVLGTGQALIATTSGGGFSYPANSLYTVEISLGGAIGTAQFVWRQDTQPFSPAITTPPDPFTPIQLSNNVYVYFPAGTYNTGDIFVIQCTATNSPSVARYEIWPRPINTPYVYPYIYRKVLPALTDDVPGLPSSIANRGDVLLEMALERAASWPGTTTLVNPYHDLNQAKYHNARAEMLINELEKKDDDIAIKNLSYKNIPFYPAPWLDGSWLQTHAIYPSP
jgi:hypothetical protein